MSYCYTTANIAKLWLLHTQHCLCHSLNWSSLLSNLKSGGKLIQNYDSQWTSSTSVTWCGKEPRAMCSTTQVYAAPSSVCPPWGVLCSGPRMTPSGVYLFLTCQNTVTRKPISLMLRYSTVQVLHLAFIMILKILFYSRM